VEGAWEQRLGVGLARSWGLLSLPVLARSLLREQADLAHPRGRAAVAELVGVLEAAGGVPQDVQGVVAREVAARHGLTLRHDHAAADVPGSTEVGPGTP
jgi:hypothetical protein